jgi:hypothetical protein
MKQVIIRSLATISVLVGLLLTEAGVAAAQPNPDPPGGILSTAKSPQTGVRQIDTNLEAIIHLVP